jgi:hypothetical protein
MYFFFTKNSLGRIFRTFLTVYLVTFEPILEYFLKLFAQGYNTKHFI